MKNILDTNFQDHGDDIKIFLHADS